MYKPGQIITVKPDGVHNKRFRITKTTGWNVCAICREANMDIRRHDYGSSCPIPYTCWCHMPKKCYPKPID